MVVVAGLFLPLISSIICGLFNKKITDKSASVISCSFMAISAACFAFVFASMIHSTSHKNIHLADWFSIGDISVSWSIYVDKLSAIMFAVISAVSVLVHIYSTGYMSDDKNLPRFMSYLSLFTFFMLLLVASDNFLQLLVGWEGVGLCSYLLIGFWYQKDSASSAALKAFVVNRISDFAFILGIISIIYYCGSAEFTDIFISAKVLPKDIVDRIAILLLVGAMGKSAQLGLHIWLADAMEGPTPVSALIHAATMVTAGVFMIIRCSFLFELSPMTLNIMAVIGAATCLFAATVALGQSDMKRVIAYSTSSQLGYMFLACGVSAYNAALFHLVTHAIFKSMIFLSAGSVIHACHEQNMEKLGGLRRKLPLTYMLFLVGSLAIIGIFPFAGYYSKDMILDSVAFQSRYILYSVGVITVFLTACYSMRILIMVFHGDSKLGKDEMSKVHESRGVMIVPISILGLGSVLAGLIGYYYLKIGDSDGYLGETIFQLHGEPSVHLYYDHLTLIVGIIGIICSMFLFSGSNCRNIWWIKNILARGYYFDEIYRFTVVKATFFLSEVLRFCDCSVIDKFGPRAFTNITNNMTRFITRIQTGYLFDYALFMMLGLIMTIGLVLFVYLERIL